MSRCAYVGCRTTKKRNARGKGISIYRIDDAGTWTLQQIVPMEKDLVNPSFLCLDNTGKFLYTIHGDESQISAYAVADDNSLTYINTVSTEGENPVHLSVDKTNRWIFVANLQTGTVSVIPRRADGGLAPIKNQYTLPGNGEGMISHPHQVQQDREGNYLIVSCQGRKQGFGQVAVFRIDSEQGTLEKTCTVRSREIAEPRHVAFHPNNRWCYGVNEKDYSVTFYDFDSENGVLEARQILPTLPETYTGDGWASGILISTDGRHIVVSNRKHDSVTSFVVDPETGMLKYCDCTKTSGGQPRYIIWDEARNLIVAANETTDTIAEIELDPATGKMTRKEHLIPTESPVCVIFR